LFYFYSGNFFKPSVIKIHELSFIYYYRYIFIRKFHILLVREKNSSAEVFKNLARYRSENNFVEPSE